MKRLICLLLVSCASLLADNNTQGDARAVGQGNVSCFLDNAASGWLNPAQISAVMDREADFSFEFYYLGLAPAVYNGSTDYFNDLKLSFVYPLGNARAGFGLNRFNSLFFNDTRLRFTFSETFKDLSLGLSLKYLRYDFPANDYTSLNPSLNSGKSAAENVSCDAGVRMEILPGHLVVSVAFLNLNEPDMGIVGEDKIDFQAIAGAGFRISWLQVGAELGYKSGSIDRFALGLESPVISKSFPVRIGFDNSFYPCLGFSCVLKQKDPVIGLDYAANLFSDIQGGFGSHYFTLYAGF
jgi:hypothetical protein